MPWVAGVVDHLREVFGQEFVDGQIRRSLRGEPVFYAEENGHQVGTKHNLEITSITYWDERGIAQSREPEWIQLARDDAKRRGITIRPANQADYRDVKREADELRKVFTSSADVCTKSGGQQA
ncbi:hypothetical protein [Noviherbaspirillum denitrificans]|uniref:Uncharacterized protein n=1 Tax=Noviherbaspirillum denitrificans TaxID=1968433 RepID=A0A254T9R7_9BURK|nr:hypothetical protein [Noviherbaspirillum denitrificans]OWW18422.1 hypothetical protein AYR66_01065 [Noviherbaspirillum denitrificans]OWW19386.1 hypothetical protein AYR66_07550 [Noviherbaspirillum denitrificans]